MGKWIVVDFDCHSGCNNQHYNPGCDDSCIRIKIDEELSEEFELFEKYMKMPCPRCSKLGEQKRSEYWVAESDSKLLDCDKSVFRPSEVQDYTNQMLRAKEAELATRIEGKKLRIEQLEKLLKTLKETKYPIG